MERESPHEEIGYRSIPASPRPLMDSGSLDYLVIGKTRMSAAEGMAMWRKQLKEMNDRDARDSRGSDSSSDQQDQTAA